MELTDMLLAGILFTIIVGIYLIREAIGQVASNQVAITTNQKILIGKLKRIEDCIYSVQSNIKEIKSLTDDIERNQRSL